MKSFLTIATLALATALVGCNNNKQETAAPGAVSGECCGGCSSETTAAPGAVSADSCSTAESCATSCSDAAAPGAVSSDCASSCETSSDKKMPVAPGAVSSDDCGAASSGCSESSAASCPLQRPGRLITRGDASRDRNSTPVPCCAGRASSCPSI